MSNEQPTPKQNLPKSVPAIKSSDSESTKMEKHVMNSKIRPFLCTFCAMILVTALFGVVVGMSCFKVRFDGKSQGTRKPDEQSSLTINQYWFYFNYSLLIGLLSVHHLTDMLLRGNTKLIEKAFFILIQSYILVVFDLILLIYYFFDALRVEELKNLKLEAILIYATIIIRIGAHHVCNKMIKRKLTY